MDVQAMIGGGSSSAAQPAGERMHQALGTCWCGLMHTMGDALIFNAAVRPASSEPDGGEVAGRQSDRATDARVSPRDTDERRSGLGSRPLDVSGSLGAEAAPAQDAERYCGCDKYLAEHCDKYGCREPADAQADAALESAKKVARAFTAEAEDWNDGTYALWHKDDLVNALVELRAAVAALPGATE